MNFFAHSVLLLLRAVQALPLAVQAALGVGLGKLLYAVAGSRRRIALRNLELCLPELSLAEREKIFPLPNRLRPARIAASKTALLWRW